MNNVDRQYLDLCRHILDNGVAKTDRTGTGTLSSFGYQMRFNLAEGFPLLTTKKMFWRGVVGELLWFIEGSTNAKYLEDKYGVKFWREWADTDGSLGPVYGEQLRRMRGYNGEVIDQLANVIKSIKETPESRRHIISLWNPRDIDKMNLPPCHGNIIQFYVSDGKLSCSMYQRSGDIFLGVPVNIASYSLLTHMIAHVTGLEVGEFVHTLGDAHIYSNHIEQVKTQLEREPRALPTLNIKRTVTDIDDFTFDDFEIIGYDPHPHIAGKVAV